MKENEISKDIFMIDIFQIHLKGFNKSLARLLQDIIPNYNSSCHYNKISEIYIPFKREIKDGKIEYIEMFTGTRYHMNRKKDNFISEDSYVSFLSFNPYLSFVGYDAEKLYNMKKNYSIPLIRTVLKYIYYKNRQLAERETIEEKANKVLKKIQKNIKTDNN